MTDDPMKLLEEARRYVDLRHGMLGEDCEACELIKRIDICIGVQKSLIAGGYAVSAAEDPNPQRVGAPHFKMWCEHYYGDCAPTDINRIAAIFESVVKYSLTTAHLPPPPCSEPRRRNAND
jgi:hypothetical protein